MKLIKLSMPTVKKRWKCCLSSPIKRGKWNLTMTNRT